MCLRARAYDMLGHTMGPPGKRQSLSCSVSHHPLVLMALTQDPEQLIEATVQFTGAAPGVNTFFKVTADLSPRREGQGQKVASRGHVQIDAVCVIRNIARVVFNRDNGNQMGLRC